MNPPLKTLEQCRYTSRLNVAMSNDIKTKTKLLQTLSPGATNILKHSKPTAVKPGGN